MARTQSPPPPPPLPADGAPQLRVVCHLDRLLEARGLSLAELARRVEMSVVNLSILKNDRAKAVRFETLARLCQELACQPGDLFSVVGPGAPPASDSG